MSAQMSISTLNDQIKQLIKDANLRDANVLFVDDNHFNLEEAKFHCPSIKTAMPDILENLLDLEQLKGKDDREHSRLKQYRVLEKKLEAKQEFSDDMAFLKAANIRVEIKDIDNIDRVIEMVKRTNQLNFTKKTLDAAQLDALLRNNNYENRAVWVSDNYGDYGLAGVYSYDKSQHRLEHFLFSCRILNLGVEQWIYAGLKFPEIEVVQPVSAELNKTDKPDWINHNGAHNPANSKTSEPSNLKRVLLFGYCDLLPISDFARNKNVTIDHIQDVADIGGPPLWSIKISSNDKLKKELLKYPFVENGMFGLDFLFDVNAHENWHLVDMRKCVKSTADITDALMHYKRRIHLAMTDEILAIMDADKISAAERCYQIAKEEISVFCKNIFRLRLGRHNRLILFGVKIFDIDTRGMVVWGKG
jgi:hypothetical protein